MSAATPEDQIRSAEQIDKDLKQKREELAATVNELAGRLDPKVLAQDAQDQAKEKANEAADKAKQFLEDAKNGNTQNIAVLAGSAAAVIALFFLRKHRKAKK